MRRTLSLVVAATLLVALAACSRDKDETEVGGEEPTGEETETPSGGGDSRIANGEFGDLGTVCQDGEASGEPDEGVSAEQIQVGVVTDKGNPVRNGLNEEMYDTAIAFAEWCNANGGINGREIVVNDRDAKLFNFGDAVTAGCDNDFAFVGGGAVFDADDNGARAECGLVNIAGYVVTAQGRSGGAQIQPIPNPVYQFPTQLYRSIRENNPEITKFGVMWADLAGVKTVRDQLTEAVEAEGFEIAYDKIYNAQGETSWRGFVDEMKDEGVQVLEMVGEPTNLAGLLKEMKVSGWYPEFITMQPNMLDLNFVEDVGDSAGENMYLRSIFPTFDMREDIPALDDYFELMETHNPDGKFPALLGEQALSSWLFFAKAASACGNDLTRECVLTEGGKITEWTAGGLHAPTMPGNEQAATCGALLQMTPEGFTLAEELTAPDDGIYNCSDDNVYELTGDYGVPRPD